VSSIAGAPSRTTESLNLLSSARACFSSSPSDERVFSAAERRAITTQQQRELADLNVTFEEGLSINGVQLAKTMGIGPSLVRRFTPPTTNRCPKPSRLSPASSGKPPGGPGPLGHHPRSPAGPARA